MAQCDVGSANCRQETGDTRICGSCMRHICAGCEEYLTTVEDEQGNIYLIPLPLARDDYSGKVPVCPACSHLEEFKTISNVDKQSALEHLISHHHGDLEEVNKHGDLDDYHDALHYGDTDPQTAGIAPYPSEHREPIFKSANVQVDCDSCGGSGTGYKLTSGDILCSHCGSHDVKANGSPVNTPLLPPGSPGAPAAGPTTPPAPQPHPLINRLFGVDPNDPIDLTEHRETISRFGVPGSVGYSTTDRIHPYSDFPMINKTGLSKHLVKQYKAGTLNPEHVLALSNGSAMTRSYVKYLSDKTGGVYSDGSPVHGVHKDHWECEKQGGTKLLPGMMCGRCGSAVDPNNHDALYNSAEAAAQGHSYVISPFDDKEMQAKAVGIKDMWTKHRSDWHDIQDYKYQQIPRNRPGRPQSLEKYLQKNNITYSPDAPAAGLHKFAHIHEDNHVHIDKIKSETPTTLGFNDWTIYDGGKVEMSRSEGTLGDIMAEQNANPDKPFTP